MLINHLSSTIYMELIVGFLLWWFAIYLITQNPFDRLTQLLFLIFASLGFYLASDSFFILSDNLHQYQNIGPLLKISTWSIYLPYALIFHLSYLLRKNKTGTDTLILYLVYLLTALIIFFEAGTNLVRNYSYIASTAFTGYIPSANGKYFWIIGIPVFVSLIFTLTNYLKLIVKERKYSYEWWKYFWPSLAIVINILTGPIIILSYYGLLPHSEAVPIALFILTALLFAYAVMKYRLFIEEPKIVFGKSLLYSTVIVIAIVAITWRIFLLYPIVINNLNDLLMPVLLVFFVVTCLPIYNWLSTFINDLLYNPSSGLSVVNDSEISQALRNYQNRSRLEDSPLPRLNIVKKTINQKNETPVDALRAILRQAIEYFRPEDEKRRTKQHLKYHFLRMLTFDQAEEGQILWELGFEDYPVRIMTNETKARPPLFKVTSPSDYSYVSRNAFLALKKEAIHDITWRISYLEKLSKRK